MDAVLIITVSLLLVENCYMFYVQHSHKTERMELVKMIAAKDYSQYRAIEGARPTDGHRSLVGEQQKKMTNRKLE